MQKNLCSLLICANPKVQGFNNEDSKAIKDNILNGNNTGKIVVFWLDM